jgi:very-short-patch-repair endonuclease
VREGHKRDLARALRRDPTKAERIMWRLLRDRRLDGAKFRRQVPIGPFIADFASIEHRVVVELDGGQHAESETDVPRDRFLGRGGWRVVRFWNNDVMANREGVLEMLQAALALTPTLSRKRERE